MAIKPISKQWDCWHPCLNGNPVRIDANTQAQAEQYFKAHYGRKPEYCQLIEAAAWREHSRANWQMGGR